MTSAIGYAHGMADTPANQVERQNDTPAHGWVARIMRSDGPAILRLLWRILGNEADVLDAYQDCFCHLARQPAGRKIGSGRAYAFRTASNIAIEIIRTRTRRRSHLPAVAAYRSASIGSHASAAAPSDDLDALRLAIARLPTHLRNVVVLRDLGKLPYDQVGRSLNIDPATARVYRRHAVVKLAELLTETAP